MKIPHTTYTYTCDLCGEEMPGEGIKLPAPGGAEMELCEKCPTRPISDLLEHFGKGRQVTRRP